MVWLAISLVLAWLAYLAYRVGDLKERIVFLERKLSEARRAEPVSTAARLEAEGVLPPARKPPAESPPRSLATRVAAVPRQSRPEIAAEAPPERKPQAPEPRERIAEWLSENGLAWMGGAVLALGGLFLVSYAAQRGFFTPAMRIAGAVAVGAVLLGVSEWLRRQADRETRGHRLAAAAAAGAGAATLYAAAWASYWLYDFIGIGAAGGLMAVISLGLLGLAVRHGEPLAILAIGGALMAPAITGPQQWAAPALTGYLGLVVVTGYATAGARRWGQAGMATLVGAALWALAGYAAEGYVRVAALAVGPVVLSIAALEWRRRRGDAVEIGGRPDSFNLMAAVAIGVAALLLAPLWTLPLPPLELAAAGLGAAALAGLAALAVRRRLIPAPIQLAAYASATLAILAFQPPGNSPPHAELWAGFVALAVAASGLWAGLVARDEMERLCAAGAALATLLLGLAVRGPWVAEATWLPAAVAAVVLGAGAWLVAKRSAEAERDLPLAIWIWCAAAGLLMALRLAGPATLAPVSMAVAAAAFGLAHGRLGWRGFAASAIAAGLASLASLLRPDLLSLLYSGHLSPLAIGAAAAVAAAVVFGASRLVRERDAAAPSGDALSTTAVLVGLTGAFLLLRLWGDREGGARLDPFLESSLRTLLILAAGVVTGSAVRTDSHPIGRWRGHVFLIAGLLHGLGVQVLALNPLWAYWRPAVSGPPFLDSLTVGFLVPAILLALATRKGVSRDRWLVALYAAAAALFAAIWSAEEVRRLFHGPSLMAGRDLIGRAELAAYAVGALLGARMLVWAAEQANRRAWTISPIADLVRLAGRTAAWVSVAFAIVVFGYGASPWWGPLDRPLDSQGAALLLFGLYLVGAAAILWIVRVAQADGAILLARVARVAAVATVFALMSLLVRWGFRGLDMRPDLQEASLETWAFSAVWGAYGFGLLVFAAARRESDLRWAGLIVLLATTAKVFLFDMARLEGVVRAGSFLAVGALLLAAAVLARRFSGETGLLGPGRKDAGPPA